MDRTTTDLYIYPMLLEKWFPLQDIYTRKMVPITGRASLFLEKLFFFKSNIKSIPFFCSSFFLCLQGQPELCGCYHLLQSCFSFFVHLHGQLEPFGSCNILQFCSSIFFCLHGCLLVTTFSSLSFLSNSLSSPLFNLLKWPGAVSHGLQFLIAK